MSTTGTSEAHDVAPAATSATAAGTTAAGAMPRGPWAPVSGAALAGSVVAYVVAVLLTIGKGFNPSDEGLIVTYATRLLQGDVPHRDFIFSRPVGSSLLHIVDVVLPTPLMMTGRVFGAIQIYVYTLCFAALVAGKPIRRLSPLVLALVVGAAAINMHTLPLMAWYTVDGLFLVAVGAYVLRWTERRWARWGALVLLGYAPLCKQSFFVAPVIGLWYLLRYHRDERRWTRVLIDLVFLGLPGVLYLAWMVQAKAIDPMMTQFRAVPPVFGKQLFDDLAPLPRGALVPVIGIALIGVVWAAAHAVARRRDTVAEAAPATGPERGSAVSAAFTGGAARGDGSVGSGAVDPPGVLVRIALVAGALAVLALPVAVVWRSKFDLFLPYGAQIMALAGGALVIGALVRRRFYDGVLLAVLAGWMAALSIGYPKANYVVGTLILAVAIPVGQEVAAAIGPVRVAPSLGLGARRALAGVGTGALALAVSLPFIALRNDHLYRERPATELTWDLGAVDADLAGISTNAATYEYLRSMRECVDQARADGAKRIAVVPDNPAMFAVLDLDNPLPINSLFPQEFIGSDHRVIDAFAALNDSPDRVAILYQVVDPAVLSATGEVPTAGPDTPLHVHYSPVLLTAFAQQQGDRSYCGPFVVVASGPRS